MRDTASHFGIQNPSKNHMCSRDLPGRRYHNLIWIFYEDDRFGDPFKNPTGSKSHPKSTKWHQKARTKHMLQLIFAFLKLGFRSDRCLMDFGRPLVHFWHPVDSNGRQNATRKQHMAPICRRKHKLQKQMFMNRFGTKKGNLNQHKST